MSRLWTILTLLIVAIAAVSAMSLKTTAQTNSDRSSKIKSLLEERRNVLEKRVEYFDAQFRNAQITLIPVLEARDDVFEAELELLEPSADRTPVLKSRLANLKQVEASYVALNREGKCNDSDVLLATSRRLQVEIELERALNAK